MRRDTTTPAACAWRTGLTSDSAIGFIADEPPGATVWKNELPVGGVIRSRLPAANVERLMGSAQLPAGVSSADDRVPRRRRRNREQLHGVPGHEMPEAQRTAEDQIAGVGRRHCRWCVDDLQISACAPRPI